VTVDTERTGKVEATFDRLFPGLKLVTTADSKTNTLQVDSEYRHDTASLRTSFNVGQSQQVNGSVATVVAYQGFGLGTETHFSQGKGLTAVNGVAAYTTDNYVFSVFGHFKGAQRVGLSHYQRVNDRFQVAFEGSVDLEAKEKASKPTFAVGGAYTVDADTTVKAKVDTVGKLSLASSIRVNRNVRLGLGTAVDLINNNKPLGFGFTFTFSE